MPELPEVETTVRGILPHIEGQTITKFVIREPRLRFRVPESLVNVLPKTRVLTVTRRAKYILIETNAGTLIIHLGMSGCLRVVRPQEVARKHDHVDIVFAHQKILRYTDLDDLARFFGPVTRLIRTSYSHIWVLNL